MIKFQTDYQDRLARQRRYHNRSVRFLTFWSGLMGLSAGLSVVCYKVQGLTGENTLWSLGILTAAYVGTVINLNRLARSANHLH